MSTVNIDARIAVLETQMREVMADVAAINEEVNIGGPQRPSVRTRLHQLEQFNAAAKAADAARSALGAVQEAKASAKVQLYALAITAFNAVLAALTISGAIGHG